MTTENSNFFQLFINSLQSLLHSLSAKLRMSHLSKSTMGEAKGPVDLWGKLGDFIEHTSQNAEDPDFHLGKHLTDDKSPEDNKHSLHAFLDGSPPEESELSQYYHRKAVRVEMHPHMGEQMQHNTMDHINSALHLARKGDLQGARLHIDLAESAMHMAGRYLNHDEYETFEIKVQKRIEALFAHHTEQT